MSGPDGLLVLNRLPSHVTPLGEWLREVAGRVTLVTSTGSAPGYRDELARVVAVEDYPHGDAVEQTAAKLLAEGGFDRVVHLIEDDVLRAARLRDDFGLPGLTVAQGLPYRDKLVMKQTAAAAGIPCPAFAAPAEGGDGAGFAARHGWPVVVKPRLGSGSDGVRIVHDAARLRAELNSRPADDVLLEQYVPGTVCHVDGVVHNGRIRLAIASEYVNGCLAFHEARPLGSAQLDPDSPGSVALVALAEIVFAAFPPIDFSPFHLEVFRVDGSGELVFCEVACRMGGAHVMETLTYATGLNPGRLYVRHQAGLDDGPGVALRQGDRRYGWLIVPPRVGRLEAIDEPVGMPWIRDFVVKTDLPASFGPARWSTDSFLGAVVEGGSHAEVVDRLRRFAAAVDGLTTWSEEG